MAKVDLLLTSGITAGDGSIISSGATLKFDSEFKAGSTKVMVQPRIYRNRELFEEGYTPIFVDESIIPYDILIDFSSEEFYVLTPLLLYQAVGDWLNNRMGGEYFELVITEE